MCCIELETLFLFRGPTRKEKYNKITCVASCSSGKKFDGIKILLILNKCDLNLALIAAETHLEMGIVRAVAIVLYSKCKRFIA